VITACAIALSVALKFNRFIELSVSSLDYQILQSENQTINYTYYFSSYADFHYSEANKVMSLTSSLFRDMLLFVTLIVINTLILIQMKQMTQRRIVLVSSAPTTSPLSANKSVRMSLHAEKRKSLMIIATGANYLIGHFLYILITFSIATASPILYLDKWFCFAFVANSLLWFSYVTPFFLYYFFNIHFKVIANETVKYVLTPLIYLARRVGVR
jgi:hypothetical protein